MEQVLGQGVLSEIQIIIFRGAWNGWSYEKIANGAQYNAGYVKDAGAKLWRLLTEGFGEEVTKQNFRRVLERQQTIGDRGLGGKKTMPTQAEMPQWDWGGAIDVSRFYGRTAELELLNQQIVERQCRVVALIGMSGIGKTALAAKFIQALADAPHPLTPSSPHPP
ncbi:MAG: ATP-binding protein, partial [Cyanobacteria bacterium RU_5_0]|nr:ATP-binding protein [Cyanobacteria bacterium RU_5_0]